MLVGTIQYGRKTTYVMSACSTGVLCVVSGLADDDVHGQRRRAAAGLEAAQAELGMLTTMKRSGQRVRQPAQALHGELDLRDARLPAAPAARAAWRVPMTRRRSRPWRRWKCRHAVGERLRRSGDGPAARSAGGAPSPLAAGQVAERREPGAQRRQVGARSRRGAACRSAGNGGRSCARPGRDSCASASCRRAKSGNGGSSSASRWRGAGPPAPARR